MSYISHDNTFDVSQNRHLESDQKSTHDLHLRARREKMVLRENVGTIFHYQTLYIVTQFFNSLDKLDDIDQ